jgi:hypothetical protein
MVVTPSCYDGIELPNHCFLRSVSECSQFAPDFPGMVFDGLLTWANERLESKWSLVCVPSRTGSPNRVLLHMKAQEIEAHVALAGV